MKLIEIGIKESFGKGEYLLKLGSRCQNLYYVVEGIVRVFYLKDGIEITDWFGTKGTIVTAMESFHLESSSDQFIQAATPTVVIRIPKLDMEKAMRDSTEIKNEYIELLTKHLLRVQQRIKALQFYPAKERYNLLIEKNPEVVKYIQRNQIASYLGISLETLSRISKQPNYLTNIKG